MIEIKIGKKKFPIAYYLLCALMTITDVYLFALKK